MPVWRRAEDIANDPPDGHVRARAQTDLDELVIWIAEHASVDVALRYLHRVQDYIDGFDLASERGTLRNELRPGLRTIGFEGRLTIAFRVEETQVLILRIFRAGQDWSDAFD